MTGDWIIPLSRRLEDGAGNFAGVALATLSIDYFRQFYATFDIRQQGTINLVLNDGTLILHSPFREPMIGMSVTHSQIFSRLLPQSTSGTAMLPSINDGVVRIYSYRQVQGYPLVIIAALAKDDILADWRDDTLRQVLIVALLWDELAAETGGTVLGVDAYGADRVDAAGRRWRDEFTAPCTSAEAVRSAWATRRRCGG